MNEFFVTSAHQSLKLFIMLKMDNEYVFIQKKKNTVFLQSWTVSPIFPTKVLTVQVTYEETIDVNKFIVMVTYLKSAAIILHKIEVYCTYQLLVFIQDVSLWERKAKIYTSKIGISILVTIIGIKIDLFVWHVKM